MYHLKSSALLISLLLFFVSGISNVEHWDDKIAQAEEAMEQQEWDKAIRLLSSFLDDSPGHLEARYLRGICYAERGKLRTHLFTHWQKGSADFDYIIHHDSLYQDVYYQYALLKRNSGDYPAAIELAHKQVELKPTLSHAEVGLFTIYKQYLYTTKLANTSSWLSNQPGEHARYFFAEALRMDEKLHEADSIYATLLQGSTELPYQPILLSRARVYYVLDMPHIAQSYVDQAISTIKNERDAIFVFEDAKYILDGPELTEFATITHPETYRLFFQKIWAKRDPTPIQPVNARLQEHYRRMDHAEKHYRFAGYTTWYNNPDYSTEVSKLLQAYLLDEYFHAKGQVYIRHGEPDDWITSVAQGVNKPNESWRYRNPDLDFHFLVSNGPIGNWRLVQVLFDPKMLEDRMIWGGTYMGMAKDPELVKDIMARESHAFIKKGFATDRHTPDKDIQPIDIPFQVATFRTNNGATLVELYYGLPLLEIARKAEQDSGFVAMEMGLALHDSLWIPKGNFREVKQMPVDKDKTSTGVDVIRFYAKPGSYHVAFQGMNAEKRILGAYKFDREVPDYSSNQTSISDLILAHNITPSTSQNRFIKNNMHIEANPQGGFYRENPVFVYYEIYNLTYTSEDIARYRITYTLLPVNKKKRLLGLFARSGGPALSISIEKESTERSPVEYAAVEIDKVRPGTYDFVVTIEDLTTGIQAENSQLLEIAR